MATKVAYTLGTSTTKSTTASVTANGKYTTSDLSASSITFYCMGNSKTSRLYVNYLSVTYSSSKTNVSVNHTLTGVKEKADNPTTIQKTDDAATFYYEAETGYELPDIEGVVVKIGATTISEDDYIWDKTTGELMIMPTGGFSDDINITITGVKKAAQKLTLTWSENGKTTTTQIDEGSAIGTLPATPSAPSGCSDKVFVGWTTTNNGATPTNDKPEFITANTIPTGNTTYYAVFATETTSEGATEKITQTLQYDTWTYSGTTTDKTSYRLFGNGSYVESAAFELSTLSKVVVYGGTFGGSSYNAITIAGVVNGTTSTIWKSGTVSGSSQTGTNTFTSTTTLSGKGTLRIISNSGDGSKQGIRISKVEIYTKGSVISYTDYITECVDCTAPTEALALTLSQETANLGEDGTAQITFGTTGGNGTAVTYAVTPTTGATLSGTTITFTQAGTYTLTASQSYTTTNGTTYCGGTDSKKIVITKTPTLYFTTTPADPIEFPEVECGGNTPLSQKQQISVQGYNLTGDVSVTVAGDYKIARTASAALSEYTTELTLPKISNGTINSTYTTVYVLSTPPEQSNSATTGTITFTTANGNTLTVHLSTPAVTCREYTLTLNDRGSKTTYGNYYAGAEVPQPADPTGVCTEPINYVFDGWATAEVAEGSTAYTKVSFPYTMPKANTTLYAVYKYTDSEATQIDGYVLTAELPSAGDSVVIAAKSTSDAWYALKASAGNTVSALSVTDNVAKPLAQAFLLESNGNNLMLKAGSNYVHFNSSALNITNSTSNAAFSLTADNGMFFLTRSDSKRWMSVSSTTNSVTFSVTSTSVSKGNFYIFKKGQILPYAYTTSPSCSPVIEGTDDITVTSAKGIWVEAVEPLNITATNLDKNADGANVTITATSLTDGFTLKTQGTNGSGSRSVTLETGYSNSTYNANLTVVYTPSADNIIEEGKIALRVYRTGGTTTYATDTIAVRGRSLPAEFVLAAKTADGWVALPADLGSSSSDAVKYPYSITVDDETAPTKAALAPRSALYAAALRSMVNTIPTGLRFTAGGKYLQGSTSTTTTNVWLSATSSEQMQTWELHSSDLTNYFVHLQAAETGRNLSYNATQGKIANYKQESRLRILPVEQTCVRYDAPDIDVHALASTSVTFIWEAIAGVTAYEYSTDGGQTWQACGDIETHGTEVKWTLPNLTSETPYTVSVRAMVADDETNCSASDSETFTTTTCDDVPVDLWVSATANTATITWRATAATATVRIYADEQGTTPVKTAENASSPCKIGGLEQNTHYYYQVLADGSCASAIANFWTESNEVSIVEWEKEAVIVDLNTEVTGADEVSILVEGQKTHGGNTKNVADDLFFSKYYEASGNLKLLGIYNGTKDTLPLTDIKIKIGNGTPIPMKSYGRKKTGYIAPDEEIILWHKGSYILNNCVEGKMDVNIMDENTLISFGGKASIALFRGDNMIDLIGAGTISGLLQGTCRPSWGDDPGWCGKGYNIENKTEEIELSTNRCLLVRSNQVKSGANAVANNTTDFITFTKDEWLGRQVDKKDEEQSSCEGFAYVADFNYNDYYTTYDSIANLEIKGNRNEDGTYTIPVPKLDTMACSNLRLQLKKNGTILATREEKVPIIIDRDADTKSTTFFGDKLTDEICKTCDVVIRDKSQLSHTEGGKQQFRDMYVYTGSSLLIPAGQAMSLDKVRMFATNDSVSYAIVNNSTDADAAISVKEVSHVKRIDGRYWYPFSLPYDCNIADIDQLNGQPLGVYGMDWGIKYYDGQRRQSDGNSETTFGEVSKYWTMMPEDGVLKAYTGYIIGLFVPAADEPLMKSVNFPPAAESAYTESADSKQTTVTNWADNLSADKRHHGWNFVGSPYISLFGAAEGEGLYNTGLKMGYTDRQGEQQDMEHIYVSIPDGGNKNTYTQSLAEGVTLRPFTAYFVQAVDPTDGQSNTLPLTYSKTQRLLLAPQRLQQTGEDMLVELTLANGSATDNAGLWVGDDHTDEYEIGRDLTKMYSADRKPQLYTVAPYGRMAYQALPDAQAHAVPLGIYVPAGGDYTLSLNRAVSRVSEAESVCLLYEGRVVADLLQAGYTLSAAGKGLVNGYTLDIRRSPKVVTGIVPAAGDAPYLVGRDGMITVANLPAGAVVQVYDVLGRICFSAPAGAQTIEVAAPQTGVYTVVIAAGDRQYILKTLLH